MTLSLALSGDSIIQRRLLSRTDPVLRPLFDLVRGSDIAFTNVEVLANDYRGDPALECGGSHFGAPAWVLDELTDAGFNLFATATNHCGDYGISGLLQSIEAMEHRGLSFAGTGRQLEDARRPCYHTHPNGTIALLSCSATFARGQDASPQTVDMPGRPGLCPLRHHAVHEVTPKQMAALHDVSESLGLEQLRQLLIAGGFRLPPTDPSLFPLGNLEFRQAERPAIRTSPNEKDLVALVRWVEEARGLATVVAVSIHAHEQGATKEDPAEFLVTAARHLIEAGADLVIGHGPHLLRGLELHRGKPIFYSLGNLIGQNELVQKIPADGYERFRADLSLTPGAVYQQRTDGDRGGFPSDHRYWESILPILRYEEGALAAIDIHPVSLGFGEARYLRGRPRLAVGDEAEALLRRFAALSEPFGTRMEVNADGASVTLV